MTTYTLTFTIVFILLPAIGLFLGFSKGRQRGSTPDRPGTCHTTGGGTCGCGCSSPIRRQSRQSCGNRPEK